MSNAFIMDVASQETIIDILGYKCCVYQIDDYYNVREVSSGYCITSYDDTLEQSIEVAKERISKNTFMLNLAIRNKQQLY